MAGRLSHGFLQPQPPIYAALRHGRLSCTAPWIEARGATSRPASKEKGRAPHAKGSSKNGSKEGFFAASGFANASEQKFARVSPASGRAPKDAISGGSCRRSAMRARNLRTLEPPVMGLAAQPASPRPLLNVLNESARRPGDVAMSWSLCINSCSSAVEGSPRRAEPCRASSASSSSICSEMAANSASCSASRPSRMPSATMTSSSRPSCRPKGSPSTRAKGSAVELQALEVEGRVEGVSGGDPSPLCLAPLPWRNSRSCCARISGITSSRM
mmetsp:Transcript_8334/g.18202  ORF Transcript_8334/g.18202 Transcript_8334/m.18202 type:complete len:272 (-) Transcript_8334:382-1197(-)